jgi:hypothetical protein
MALRADWPKYVMTSLFHCWRSTAEKIVYIFSTNDLSERNCLYRCPAEKPMRYRASWTFNALCYRLRFDKILPKQVGYFGIMINLKPHCIQSSRVVVPAGTSKSTSRRHGIQVVTRVMAYVADAVTLWRCLQQCVFADLNWLRLHWRHQPWNGCIEYSVALKHAIKVTGQI